MTEQQKKVQEIHRLLEELSPREYALGVLMGSVRKNVRERWPREQHKSVCQRVSQEIGSWEDCEPLSERIG